MCVPLLTGSVYEAARHSLDCFALPCNRWPPQVFTNHAMRPLYGLYAQPEQHPRYILDAGAGRRCRVGCGVAAACLASC